MKFRALIFSAFLVLPLSAQASCDLEYDACDATCAVKHFSDDAGKAGCTSKCVAQQGLCLAEKGIDNAAEVSGDVWDATSDVGKKALDSTKSFFKGLTED